MLTQENAEFFNGLLTSARYTLIGLAIWWVAVHIVWPAIRELWIWHRGRPLRNGRKKLKELGY